jgi:hypothetical protein
MIHRKRRGARSVQGGYFRFETSMHRCVSGFGDGDFIRLRDEYGNTWRGMAERQDDNTVRYRFRDSKGRTVSGISDDYGIILRDQTGTVWRGFVM